MVGATVSCSHEKETGSDWLPAGSTAHTVSVWLPSGRFENVGHCPHVAGACPSSWHRNVPLSVEENAKYALLIVTCGAGCCTIETTGATVSTVHVYEAVLDPPVSDDAV